MEERSIRHVPVVDEADRLLGIVSQRDVLRSQEPTLSDRPSSDQIDRNRVLEAQRLMTESVRTVARTRPLSLRR